MTAKRPAIAGDSTIIFDVTRPVIFSIVFAMGNCAQCSRRDVATSSGVKDKASKSKLPSKAPRKDGVEPPKAPQKGTSSAATEESILTPNNAIIESEDSGVHLFAMFLKVPKFKAWHRSFMQNSKNATLGKGSNIYILPSARASYCREKETKVFREIHDEMKVLVLVTVLDLTRFTSTLASAEMKRLRADLEVFDELPIQLQIPLQPTNECHYVLYVVQVEDFDWWYAGFMQHGKTRSGTWGFSVPFARAEFADDSRTLVFRGINAPNRIAIAMFDVDLLKFVPMLRDRNFVRLQGVLGEIAETRSVTSMKSGESLTTLADTDCNMFEIIGMPAWCKPE